MNRLRERERKKIVSCWRREIKMQSMLQMGAKENVYMSIFMPNTSEPGKEREREETRNEEKVIKSSSLNIMLGGTIKHKVEDIISKNEG